MKYINLPEFLDDFFDYLISIKNLSKTYISSMKVTIRQFLEFMNTYKLKLKYKNVKDFTLNDIRTFTNSDIYSFMFYLAESHYKVSSRILKTEHLKVLFDYLYKIKHDLFKEPFKQIKSEKKNFLQLPNYLSIEESKMLLRVYANSTKIQEVRDNAIMNLILNSGLRLSEVINLEIPDFNFNDNTFLIHGKGKKERIGYLNNSSKKAILKYLKLRNEVSVTVEKDKNILFLSLYKKRLTSRNVQARIDKAYEMAGLDSKKYSVHTLRHTCATLLYKSGTDIKTIQEILGHVRVSTTEIYTHLHDKEVMNAILTHPLAKFKMNNALQYGT